MQILNSLPHFPIFTRYIYYHNIIFFIKLLKIYCKATVLKSFFLKIKTYTQLHEALMGSSESTVFLHSTWCSIVPLRSRVRARIVAGTMHWYALPVKVKGLYFPCPLASSFLREPTASFYCMVVDLPTTHFNGLYCEGMTFGNYESKRVRVLASPLTVCVCVCPRCF